MPKSWAPTRRSSRTTPDDQPIINLYNEQAGILDGEADGEVDLTSHAYQIWKNATAADSGWNGAVTALPDVVFSSRQHSGDARRPEGILVYLRTADDNDALAYIGRDGQSITESPIEILNAAQCLPDTPAHPRHEEHHQLVAAGAKHIAQRARNIGGQLGRPSSARYRAYNRLKEYAEGIKGQLFDSEDLRQAINDIYRYPLRQAAVDTLNRQMRSGIDDPGLADLVIQMRDEDRLCIMEPDDAETQEPRIICSMAFSTTRTRNHPMAADIRTLSPYLQAFDLTSLMVEGLGWNHLQSAPIAVVAGNESYDLHTVAEKARLRRLSLWSESGRSRSAPEHTAPDRKQGIRNQLRAPDYLRGRRGDPAGLAMGQARIRQAA